MALKIPGVESMQYISCQEFVVGVVFWLPLERKDYCKWKEIATRLSPSLIFENLSKLCHSYEMRVKCGPHKERDPFHHFLEMSYEKEDVVKCNDVVKSCHDPSMRTLFGPREDLFKSSDIHRSAISHTSMILSGKNCLRCFVH